jgi:hypothetical protein
VEEVKKILKLEKPRQQQINNQTIYTSSFAYLACDLNELPPGSHFITHQHAENAVGICCALYGYKL